MFSGYWRQPGETLAAWRDLWHHTGDYGALDARGNLSFVDRKSDSMRRRGENISSLQLEAAILEHPNITDVAVHAVPSSMTEDDIKACIVLVPGADLQPAFDEFAQALKRRAAELLRESWTGRRVVELEGPQRISPDMIAESFARLLGRDVAMRIVPRDTWEELFRSQGMKNPTPRMQMIDGFNEEWICFEGAENEVRKGRVPLDTVLQSLIEKA